MNTFYFSACIFGFLTVFSAVGDANSGCLEREKALALLGTAEDFLSKAKDSYPSCQGASRSTNQSECSGQKSLAYIEISQKLISDVKENFPICNVSDTKVIVDHFEYGDCSEILAGGHLESGVYTIWLNETNTNRKQLQVYCDMKTDGGGWTMIQRRGKYPSQIDFYLDWESYKVGFGNISKEFWLGNENIRILCNKGCQIRFDLQDEDGIKGYAVYKNFHLSGNNYTIDISKYMGNVGDCMEDHNGKNFSTKDKGNTYKASVFHGAMWYTDYNYCNFNGVYKPGEDKETTVHWFRWRKYKNLASVEIKVRPN